ncbi:DUF4055 domain-containing protein [Mesoterricola sediminis]|uniref:DUF4055 domain-containing protein n=1 Tax=Mesoterricola sediminis TaxID=2927980 RepID=A0AA48GRK8_9BACT|nr:DUF4055 domain-containing protein [Mesoterricola sediminis]BDU76287.1 hypothetical protein METESE_12450 [Mesoterricola sediminis]
MGISTRHPTFQAIVAKAGVVRDVVEGEDAVKAKKTKYLPKIGGQSEDEYDAYRNRAMFYGATGRTLEALSGAVCRKAATLHGPETWVKKYAEDVTGTGVSLNSMVGEMVRETLTTSMVGILVDHNGKRPYISSYVAENVINSLPDGTIVLSETEWVPSPEDKYTLTQQTNYRELVPIPGGVQVNLWKPDTSGKLTITLETVLDRRGDTSVIQEPPFVLAQLPSLPLLPLANANLSHYRTSADLENGLHWGGIFTPWVAANLDGDKTTLKIGDSNAWILPQGSTVGMLEVTGAALSALETNKKAKEDLMAALGARLLVAQKKTAETEATARINAGGEGATLSMTVDTIETTLTKAARIMARWDGLSDSDVESIRVEINRDFVDARLSAQDIAAYLSLYTAGTIDLETFLLILQGGEVLPDGRTPEQIRDLLDTQAPPMAASASDPAANLKARAAARKAPAK